MKQIKQDGTKQLDKSMEGIVDLNKAISSGAVTVGAVCIDAH